MRPAPLPHSEKLRQYVSPGIYRVLQTRTETYRNERSPQEFTESYKLAPGLAGRSGNNAQNRDHGSAVRRMGYRSESNVLTEGLPAGDSPPSRASISKARF